jgi:hypothetical protein
LLLNYLVFLEVGSVIDLIPDRNYFLLSIISTLPFPEPPARTLSLLFFIIMSADHQDLFRGEKVHALDPSDAEIAEKSTKAILQSLGRNPAHGSSLTPPASEDSAPEESEVRQSGEPLGDSNTTATQSSRPRGLAVSAMCFLSPAYWHADENASGF